LFEIDSGNDNMRQFGIVAGLCGILLFVNQIGSLSAADPHPNPTPHPPLPEAISSFGATVGGDYLYVFSGHMGRVPGSSIDGLSPHFSRLNLNQPGSQHEALAMHNPSQSPGLVAWRDQIYRVGGLSFKNHVGEETAFQSLATFSKYDPKTNTWRDLASLPTPRSSLDAAVVGDRLYVVGGWNLQAGSAQDAPWHEDALVFDLTREDGQWKPIAKPPFVKRALAAAAHHDKLYVLGGMNNSNAISEEVHIYDPVADHWSVGPELPGRKNSAGFAISAFAMAGTLYFSGSEGMVYRLNEQGTAWQPVERLLFPRSFHRLVAGGNGNLVAIGGVARGGGYLANLEVIRVGGTPDQKMKLTQWSVEFPGQAKQGQALVLNGSSLYAFGGNRSRAPHDFSKEAFLDEAFRFDIATRTVEKLSNLPQPVQGASAQLTGNRNDQSIHVFGGLAHPGEKFSSIDSIFQYRVRSKSWTDEIAHLPTSRAMFNSVFHEGGIWVFGGSRVNAPEAGLVKETWRWDIVSEQPATIVPNASIPVPRRSFGGAVLGESYYAVGGLGADSKIVAPTNVFDFKTGQWSEVAALKVPRVFPNLATAAGKLFLYGGFASVDGHFQTAKSLEVYDPASKAWTTALETLPFDDRQMTVMEYQDRLLFYGIDKSKDGLAHFALLDPSPTTVGFGTVNPAEDRGPSDSLTARLMRMDRNKDGALTKDEVGERFLPLIARIDENADGTASKEEIAAFALKQPDRQTARGAGRGPRGGGFDPVQITKRIFEENDKDQDGTLTGTEIPERIQRDLERIDANKDGKIQKSELEADFQQRIPASSGA